MSRRRFFTALLCGSAILAAQSFPAPKFEVASVKAFSPGAGRGGFKGGPGTDDPTRFSWHGATLAVLIGRAYELDSRDQVSGPDWINSERYSVDANVPAGATPEQFRQMLQNLLAERFKLAFHRGTASITAYDLVIGKNGPKLKKSSASDGGQGRPAMCQNSYGPNGITVTCPNSSMADFVRSLAAGPLRRMEGPGASIRVNDKTGLTGTYDITFNSLPGDDSDLFHALESQLGLKLEPKKLTVDVLIVDRAEKVPLEN